MTKQNIIRRLFVLQVIAFFEGRAISFTTNALTMPEHEDIRLAEIHVAQSQAANTFHDSHPDAPKATIRDIVVMNVMTLSGADEEIFLAEPVKEENQEEEAEDAQG